MPTTPQVGQRSGWLVGPLVVGVVVLGVTLVLSGTWIHRFTSGNPCPLPALIFEVDRSEPVRTRWLPPEAVCRWTLTNGEVVIERQSHWTVYSPVPVVLALGVCVQSLRRRVPSP